MKLWLLTILIVIGMFIGIAVLMAGVIALMAFLQTLSIGPIILGAAVVLVLGGGLASIFCQVHTLLVDRDKRKRYGWK